MRGAGEGAGEDLVSWADGPVKAKITEFVRRVTTAGGPEFLPEPERLAVFDNDGTLWAEQPCYVQYAFVQGRLRELAGSHPEWRTRQPFRAALEGGPEALLAGGDRALLHLVMETHAGMTTEEFAAIVRDWIATARHPRFQRPYTDLVYVPMLEMLAYLRERGFRTYIVSGGGIEFMRAWVERVYGIPPHQVVGSSIRTRFELRGGAPVLARLPEMDFLDDREGKPVAIHRFIGQRPVLAVGNSDGDLQMLQWTTGGSGSALGLLLHHTDGEREWEYDRASSVGRLDQALDEAPERGWTVVDMRRDWRRVFAFQETCC